MIWLARRGRSATIAASLCVGKRSILAQKPLSSPVARRHRIWWLAVPLVTCLGVAAFGIAPDTLPDRVQGRLVIQDLPTPPTSEDDALGFWHEVRVERGDTVGSVLARADVTDPAAASYLRTDKSVAALYQLRPGKSLRVETDEQGHLLALRYMTAQGNLLSVERDGDK